MICCFSQAESLHIKYLIKMKLTDMFGMSRCSAVPKIMQIGAGI